MSVRGRFWSSWLGLAAAWGCLNPQPDTGPLVTDPAAPGVVVDVGTPSEETVPVTPGSNSGGFGNDLNPLPAQEPVRTSEDAGVPPADAGPPNPANPAVSTSATRDAGLLEPDAGAGPPGPVGD